MGMAAGQARLLSITSRMSDNELRAQIINNNKMRLASESSQVSEAYVTALNQAQLMFANYDADNNASYKQLTFNALTSYNPYNNQYCLVNSSGSVLISETDAQNYDKSGGELDTFLAAYGLKKTTTYFDNLKTGSSIDGNAIYTNASGDPVLYNYYDEEGNLSIQSSGFTRDDLKKIFYGKDETALKAADLPNATVPVNGKGSIDANGYDITQDSEAMYNYTKLMTDYVDKKTLYYGLIADAMDYELDKLVNDQFGDDFSTEKLKALISSSTDRNDFTQSGGIFDKLKAIINSANASDYIYTLGNRPTEAEEEQANETQAYFDYLLKLIQTNGGAYATSIYNAAAGYTLDSSTGNVVDAKGITRFSGLNGTTINVHDDSGNIIKSGLAQGAEFTDEDGDTSWISWTTGTNWEIQVKKDNSLANLKNTANTIVKSLEKAIYKVWDPDKTIWANTNDTIKTAYKDYIDAGNALAAFMFGEGKSCGTLSVSGSDYTYTPNNGMPSIKDLDAINDVYNGVGNGYPNFTDDMYQVFLNIVLDNVMDTYGEPKTTWIDIYNHNENGEAKAQWYENLFNRIEKSGYQVLKDGLAASPEWIQFAFESGVITMEQVDENNNWNNLIYSNCSDITQQTDSVAVTKAEAEYKTAMNKIENKDKRYDLELKNIDTEHNSLQTEYESIKAAIDKNVERTFKLYS